LELKGILDALLHPLGNLSKLGGFASRRLGALLTPPNVEVRSGELHDDAARLAKSLGSLGSNVEALLRRYRESILERQYLLGRVADAATELYVSGCVLNRLDAMLTDPAYNAAARQDGLARGRFYLIAANRRIARSLAELWDNDDEETTRLADRLLG
jgi:hypothetical protein